MSVVGRGGSIAVRAAGGRLISTYSTHTWQTTRCMRKTAIAKAPGTVPLFDTLTRAATVYSGKEKIPTLQIGPRSSRPAVRAMPGERAAAAGS